MSLFASWLPARNRPNRSNHELPLYNSPPLPDDEPAFPPPALGASMQIATSMYLSPPSSVAGSPSPQLPRLELPERVPEGMVWLQRREKQLEQELHKLLDAQSDALMAGIGGPSAGDRSATETPSSPRRDSTERNQSRTSETESTDLISVRRSIYKTVRELTAVKSEQEALVKG